MKKLIIAIVMAFVGVTSASAEIAVVDQNYRNVQQYVMKFIPDAKAEEITACYNAVKNGNNYQIKRRKIKIECDEEEMIVFRRLF